ncbi:hypothetical protein C8A00DRAFT_37509 [Chaetomidium leptoderma]|uniref:Uncharacterized protein n=1 Tax=Chaetomidium leptoderma TaxID=669021 RepID=A0AAN6ZTQ0_9PEZI|nr:hypothetical protein C8A00DRAFT_37509 [Chaetomidium leptoderma]
MALHYYPLDCGMREKTDGPQKLQSHVRASPPDSDRSKMNLPITNFYYIAGGGDRSTTLGLPARTIISPIIDREDGGRLPIEVVEGMIRRPMMRHELPREFRSARADLDPEGLVIPRLRRQEAGFNRVPAPPPRPVPLCSIIPSQIPSPTFGGGRTRRAAGRRRLLYTSDADDLERPGSDSDCSTDGSSSSSEDLAIVRRNARRLRDALLTSFQDGSLRPYGNYESPGARDLASTYAVHGGRFHNNRRARDSAAETERLVQVCELGRGRAGVVADGASSAAACQPCEQVVVPETRAAAVDGEEEGGPEDARVRLLPRVSVVEDEASGRESGGVRLQ